MKTIPGYCPSFKDFRQVSYSGLQLQKPHQNTLNPLKLQLLNILDLPDLPDDDQNFQKIFLSVVLVSRILKRYDMYGFSGKNEIVPMTPNSEALCHGLFLT